MNFAPLASRLGFDPARLVFAFRTAVAACLALVVAWRFGLEHPQWSAMTVWAASQPVRGMLLEKSLFRAAGTLAGTLVGVLLVMAAGDRFAVVVVGLALWIGFCAGVGNLLRGLASYGVILAGYSAAMVSLLATPHPDRILELGIDRFLTVMVGVLVAMLVGWFLTPKAAEDEIAGRVRRLLSRVLRDMAASLAGAAGGWKPEQRAILSEMAALEEALDPHGAGSLRSRRVVRKLRAMLIAQASALLWLRRSASRSPDQAMSAALAEAALAVENLAPPDEVVAALGRAREPSRGDASLHEVVAGLETTVRERLGVGESAPASLAAVRFATLHRDWVGARQALMRAAGVMLSVGAVWLLTGWSGGAFVLLGTAVMISLFSTHDNPAVIMRHVLFGQLVGVSAALACRWLVWPLAGGEFGQVLLVTPFILVGTLPLAHRRTMLAGYDYNLTLLLLLQPAFPLAGAFSASLATALGVVAAPVVALIAFSFAFPADVRRRMGALIAAMIGELQVMAGDADAARHRDVWRARLYHRLLRLVRWTEKAGERRISAIDGSLAVLQLGDAILRMQALRREPDLPPSVGRAVAAALKRMRTIGAAPERAARALQRVASRLAATAPADADRIRDAAGSIADNRRFFRRP